jgi:hypothetical protein
MRRERRAANVQKMKREISNIEVQIDELVLHGFRAVERYIIGDALSNELSQLIMNAEALPFDRDFQIPVQRAGEISILPDAKPASIGAKVAQAVHAGLNTINKGGHS